MERVIQVANCKFMPEIKISVGDEGSLYVKTSHLCNACGEHICMAECSKNRYRISHPGSSPDFVNESITNCGIYRRKLANRTLPKGRVNITVEGDSK